ncbi:MAG: hypothetical protein ABIJ12_09345 [bacterium]
MRQFITISSILIISGLIIVLLIIVPSNILSQDKDFIVKLNKDNHILKLNPNSKEKHDLYLSNKYKVHSLTVSPDNRYVAFIEETKPEYAIDGYVITPEYCLVILDDMGKLVSQIDKDIKKYVWSPDGNEIAFLTFNPCDPDYQYKCPTGVWAFDIATSNMKKICDRATEINWAQFDSAVYLYNLGVVTRWDPITEKLDTTEFKDIYFSPDGKYYLRLWKDEGKPIQLYNTITNELEFNIKIYKQLLPIDDFAEQFPQNIGELWSSHDLEYPHGWVFNKGHYLLFTKRDVIIETTGDGPIKVIKSSEVSNEKNFIYDPEQKMIVREFESPLSSWVGDGNCIVIEREYKIELIGGVDEK